MRRDRFDIVAGILCLLAGLLVMALLAGCGKPRPETPRIAPEPAATPAPPPVIARADIHRADARATVDELRAALAAAEDRERSAERRRQQAADDAATAQREADERERMAIVATQARWGTRLAGLVFAAGILLTIAAVMMGFPRRWGALGAASGLGILVASRLWAWAGEHVLLAALVAAACGAAVGLWLLIQAIRAARLAAAHADRMEAAETSTDVNWAKAEAIAEQTKAGVHGLIRRVRARAATAAKAYDGDHA